MEKTKQIGSENSRNTHQIAIDRMKLIEPCHVHKKYEQIEKSRTTAVVDKKEQSRYEKERNLVAAVITIQGGHQSSRDWNLDKSLRSIQN